MLQTAPRCKWIGPAKDFTGRTHTSAHCIWLEVPLALVIQWPRRKLLKVEPKKVSLACCYSNHGHDIKEHTVFLLQYRLLFGMYSNTLAYPFNKILIVVKKKLLPLSFKASTTTKDYTLHNKKLMQCFNIF